MSFASLAQPAVEPLVERFATARSVTLIVGAGASMESDLPSWRDLVEKLLMTVAQARPALSTADAKKQWVEQSLRRDDLLGAGAVVEVMGRPLDVLVPEQLYGEVGPQGFAPGAIAQQVAYLHDCFGEAVEILTTNYDDLVEQALIEQGVPKSKVRSYVTNRSPSKRVSDAVGVIHLHGLAGRNGAPKKIVLTEEHYHRMQRGRSWQEKLVTARLEESLCLFVGTSLADPNLIRYLYGYQAPSIPRHAAIFVRQGEPSCLPEVRMVREEAAARRWGRCGVEAVFVDHYADAAQLLYEIGYRRKSGAGYEPVGRRAASLLETIEHRVLLADGTQGEFALRQVALSGWLRRTLYVLLEAALGGQSPPADEKLALGLWLLSRDGTHITGWAHSDRAHQDPATIAPVEVAASSEWVAIRAICRGGHVELDRDNYASRWRFVRALPLIVDSPSRLLVGCITIASSKPRRESVLGPEMPEERRAGLHRALVAAVRGVVDAATAPEYEAA